MVILFVILQINISVLHGLGDMSELAMPKYKLHPYLEEFLYGKEGNFEGLKQTYFTSRIITL